MDLINKYFIEYENALVGRLKSIDFLNDESTRLLSETSSAILHIIRNTNLEAVIKILLSDDPSTIINLIDTISMAAKLGMDVDKVTSGLEAISPVIKQVFIQKNKEIVTATASLAWETTDEDMHSVNDRSA